MEEKGGMTKEVGMGSGGWLLLRGEGRGKGWFVGGC